MSGGNGGATDTTVQTGNEENTAPTSAVKESFEIDNGRKVVYDNFDMYQRVHHMSEVNQNIDNHWVVHMSIENRISGKQHFLHAAYTNLQF